MVDEVSTWDRFYATFVRQLVRPYRNGIAWNPADDLCHGFRVRAEHADRRTMQAEIRALAAFDGN